MTASDPSNLRGRQQQQQQPHQAHHHAPTKASLKAWWSQFTFATRAKKHTAAATSVGYPPKSDEVHLVFGKPLRESLKYASVQISTASPSGDLYVWGYIPVVVAKCGLYLKENATEVEGTFRVNGSNKRMRELQAIFEMPPRYGKSMDWKKEAWTTHDVASVFRRYLTQMPEPVVPVDMYHAFRQPLATEPVNQEEAIAAYKRLIHQLPRANQYLLLYVLDLLSVFARKADKNRMDAANLAVIFRPGILSHPDHELNPNEHRLSQKVLEFLIEHQDWFMVDVNSPPRNDSVMVGAGNPSLAEPEPWERRIGVPGDGASPAGSNTVLPLPSAYNPPAPPAPPADDWAPAPPEKPVARRRTLNDRSRALAPPEAPAAGGSAPAWTSPLAAVDEGAFAPPASAPDEIVASTSGGAGVHRSRTWASSRTGRSSARLSREGSLRRSGMGSPDPAMKPLPRLPDEAHTHERRVLRKRPPSKDYSGLPPVVPAAQR